MKSNEESICLTAEEQQAKAWWDVVNTLNEVFPGWQHREGTGSECAVAAIRELAKQAGTGV